ncbi:hypothetical protein CPB84DRAFT_1790927 [Gymnopilus junonius]|uniref:Uncharacterized protein n=1 Tax=Gymnopilus junonius TaxID=109634 RepID=A0A9P5NGL1_GYMJU|nr:hypothetical protein CPB84DRAFT_1790927 [Gymnopilus junonius]
MADLNLFFKLVDTGDFVSDPQDSYTTQKDQLVYDLKTNVASYYNLRSVTSLWLLRLGSDSGTILENDKTIAYYKLKDNDVLFFDPELAKITYSDNGQTKSLWAKRSDTISAVESRAFPGNKDDISFGFKSGTVQSLFDRLSLVTIRPPKTILQGVTEGEYRLRNLNYYLRFYSGPIRAILTSKDSEATYFEVRLASPPVLTPTSAAVTISWLSRAWFWYGPDYRKPGSDDTLVFTAHHKDITLSASGSNTGYYNISFSPVGDNTPQYLVLTNAGELKIDPKGNMPNVSRDWYFDRRP